MDKPRIPSPAYDYIRRQAMREGEAFGACIAAAAQQVDAEDRERRVRAEVGEAAVRLAAYEYRRGQREGVEAGKGMGYLDGYEAGYAAGRKARAVFPWWAFWALIGGCIIVVGVLLP